MLHAGKLAGIARGHGIPFIFKASYDKANRSSISSYRGPGIEEGLRILSKVSEEFGVPVLSDIHSPEEAHAAAEVLDVLQIPAFLCRQTDLIVAAASTKKPVNIKKGQFMSPQEMSNVAEKAASCGNDSIMLTERGTTFGYNYLVNDFRALQIMGDSGCPVIYDATHSVQRPGGQGDRSGGESRFVPCLSRAAVAAGCDGLFLEVHEDPEKALSDGPNMLRFDLLDDLLSVIVKIEQAVR
jgi:2-dehydro-3-deoxyphosphooctonate aldolase (KDO 8-P synthase)